MARMKAGEGSMVANARTLLRTVSVMPGGPHALAGHVADQHHDVSVVDDEDVAEVAAHELGLEGRAGDHAQLEAGDVGQRVDEVLLQGVAMWRCSS